MRDKISHEFLRGGEIAENYGAIINGARIPSHLFSQRLLRAIRVRMCALRVIITSAWRENTCRASSLPSSHFWIRHGPAAVDIINPNPRCNAISAHCARATSGYETQFSLFTPFPMRTPFSPYPVSFTLRGKKRGGEGGGGRVRRNQFANVSGRSCVFLAEAFFSLLVSLPFSQGPRTARGVPAAEYPRHEYSGRREKEGRKKKGLWMSSASVNRCDTKAIRRYHGRRLHAHVVSRRHCGGCTIRGDLTLCVVRARARPLWLPSIVAGPRRSWRWQLRDGATLRFYRYGGRKREARSLTWYYKQ